MTTQRTYTNEEVNDIAGQVAAQISRHYQKALSDLFNELYDTVCVLSKRLGITDDKLGAEYEAWADEHDARFEWPEA